DGLPKREVRQDNHSSHHPELAAGFKRRGRRGPCLATEGVSGRIAGVSSLRAKSSTLVASTTPQTGAATAAEMPADNLWLTVGSTVASGGVIACLLVGAYKREHRLSVDRRKDSIDYLMSDGDLSEDEK
ncbi:putative transmembrane protein, partial [Gregarina niphandrodes]